MTEQGKFYDCAGCGARLTFKPGSEKLRCEYCGHEQAIDEAGPDEVAVLPQVIEEHDLQTALRCAPKLADFDVAPRETLMVGDTEFDLEMARNAGVASVGVSYGAHSVERLLQFDPLDCMNAIDELPALLRVNGDEV